MDLSEKKVDIAHRLYQCRKTAKNLLGDQYTERIAEYQAVIRNWMPHHDNDVLKATLFLAEKITDHVYGTIFLMAAAVEMLEPSESKAPSESKEGER